MNLFDQGYHENVEFALEMLEQCKRQSGRTVAMVDSAKDDDVIIVHSAAMQRHIERLLVAKRVNAQVIIWDPIKNKSFPLRGRSIYGNVHFDNAFLYLFYKEFVKDAKSFLNSVFMPAAATRYQDAEPCWYDDKI